MKNAVELMGRDIRIKFHKDWFSHSKVDRGDTQTRTHTHTHTQTA
jgi:hypothetical protein